MIKTYDGLLTVDKVPAYGIYVCGTNTQGLHNGGTANYAHTHFGLEWGHSEGLSGRAFGLVTKDKTQDVHPSVAEPFIKIQIHNLYEVAKKNAYKYFYICYSGRGDNRSGYSAQQMADMFSSHPIPNNIVFEKEFSKLLKPKSNGKSNYISH